MEVPEGRSADSANHESALLAELGSLKKLVRGLVVSTVALSVILAGIVAVGVGANVLDQPKSRQTSVQELQSEQVRPPEPAPQQQPQLQKQNQQKPRPTDVGARHEREREDD